MYKSVEKYYKRRQRRLDGRVEKPRDSVAEYRRRRDARVYRYRADASARLAYGIAKGLGINTEGMEPQEVWEAIKDKDPGAYASAHSGGRGGSKAKGGGAAGGKSGGTSFGRKDSPDKEVRQASKRASEIKAGAIKKSDPSNDRKQQECDGSGYKGKPGEVKGGKNGALAPKSDISKRIDVSDAIAEIKTNKEKGSGIQKNSLTDFIDENGNLTPERQKVHDEIVQKFFDGKVPHKGKATMIMSGGGPASGKSFVKDNAESRFGEETVLTVDPDAIKAMLPGYADLAVAGDEAAGFYHEESSALAKRIYQYALDNNLNVVYDGTGDGSVGSVKKKIKQAQDSGYAVTGEYVTVNVDGDSGAIVRNKNRYEHAKKDWEAGRMDIDPPRLVGEDHVKKIHMNVSDIAPDVAPLFDEWTLTDNNVPKGAKRPVIATCKKGGEIEVVKGMEKKVQDWLDKGSRGGKVVNGRIVFPKR